LDEDVLLKDNSNYKLSIAYLEELVRFGVQTKQAYRYKEEFKEKFQGVKGAVEEMKSTFWSI